MISKMRAILVPLILFGCAQSFALDLKPGAYTFDKTAKVSFSVVNFVVMTVDGEFSDFNCAVKVEADFEKSTVDCKIMVKSIHTGNEERDAHLKTDDFFAVEKFSEILFKSETVKGTAESFVINGKLTIRDIPKEVTFEGHYVPAKDKTADHFEAGTKINRQDFDVKSGSTIKDSVRLKIAGPLVLK